MDEPPDVDTPNRKRFQFSLASAVVLMPLAAGLLYLHVKPNVLPITLYWLDSGILLASSLVACASQIFRSKNETTIFFCVIGTIAFSVGLFFWAIFALEYSIQFI
jgi:heme/copper-type cytochrome/quinol oxidase subunit 3